LVLRKATAEADFFLNRKASALRSELAVRALRRSADFVERHMASALLCRSRLEHLTFTAAQAGEGAVLEFGVHGGFSINHLARMFPHRTVYGFDSFLGLPEAWAGHRYSKVNFDRQGKPPKVAANVKLVVGWFQETLPGFVAQLKERVALAHIDCDIYSSTATVLQHLAPKLTAGSVLVFDEFFNHPSFEQHELKAFFEFAEKHGVQFEYLGYAGEQVSVKIKAITPVHD
jgi:predicted O-methyltransferase YrrM